MTLLLAPGPDPVGPSSAIAAVRPAGPAPSVNVFDATGKGIGCQTRSSRYQGPKEPEDPPWPPGAEPTPAPEPSIEPSPQPLADASTEPAASPEPAPSAEPEATDGSDGSEVPSASGQMMLLATELAPEAEPTLAPDDGDADIAPDVDTPVGLRQQALESDLISGIDVSHHNGDIDYARVRDAGNEFVFIKATQDNEFVDPMFQTNLSLAREAGLAAGGYHFFDYTLDGTDQADHFVDRLELAGGIDDALPPVVDVECWAPIGASIHAVSTARLRDFVGRVYERTGRLPIIYTSVFMWKEVVGNAEGFEDHPLWAACWGCDAPPSTAAGWDGWAFWQTGVNNIAGVGRLDGNFFSGSADDLDGLRLRPLTIESGAPATASQEVGLDLGGRVATHVRTSTDGETWSDWSAIRSLPQATLGPEEGSQSLYVQLRNGPRLTSPVYRDSITLDRRGPGLSTPVIRLLAGPLASDLASVPIEISWEAVDDDAGLSDASVTVTCDDAEVIRSVVPGSAAPGELSSWMAATTVRSAASCEITVIGRDGAGNLTRTAVEGVEAAVLVPSAGALPSAPVQGDQIGIIAQRGPDGGRATVLLDGQPTDLIDLYAPEPTGPEIVYVADVDPGTSQRISVEATATSDPASGGSSVVIDGFVTLVSSG